MKQSITHNTFFNKLPMVMLLGLISLIFIVMGVVFVQGQTVSARPAFKAGNIISDSTMRAQKMSRKQIQDFLNRKGSDCTSGSNCLKNYKQGGKTAAQIIYDTAKRYKINPQVFIVLIQKETGLVTMNDPGSWRYRTATGYGCPDHGDCDKDYFGFTNQVRWAGIMYDAILKNSPTWYAPYTVGWNDILYHPYNNCGKQKVYIQNRATAALYSYTPYVPNKAALKAGYGTGNKCSSYGNRNFHNYFSDWFQSTEAMAESEISHRYASMSGRTRTALGVKTSGIRCGLHKNGCYQNYEHGAILWTQKTGAWESLGSIRNTWIKSGYERGSLGYPRSGEIKLDTGGWYQRYENGYIIGKGQTGYWESKGSIRKEWVKNGLERGILGYPTGPEQKIASGGWRQTFEKGVILGKPRTGYRALHGGIFQRYKSIGMTSSSLHYPTSAIICGLHKNGCYQNYEHGAILWTQKTGAWESHGSIRNTWIRSGYERGSLGYPKGPEVSIPTGGWQQEYENGFIVGKGKTGYWESKGSIRARWIITGSAAGSMGYPTGPEQKIAGGGWAQSYEKGQISGSGKTGYWDSNSAISARYHTLNGPAGKLGYPTGPTVCGIKDNGCYQNFQRGAILWKRSTGAWESLGTIRTFWITKGRENSKLGYPAGGETRERDGSWTQRYEGGTIKAKRGAASATYR